MRTPAQHTISLIVILIICFISMEVFAGTSPPDPGGDPSGGGPPVGGGAPIGNGIYILISAGLIYAVYKMKSFLRLKEKTKV